MATIKGKWRAPYGYANISAPASADVNFKSGPDINYCGMRLEEYGYIYYKKDASGDSSKAYDNYDSWQMNSYRTVDFGDTEQEVTDSWYEVFTSVYRPLVTIKGKWVLGDTLSESVSLDEEVNFTADGVLYCRMNYYAYSDGKGYAYYYYGSEPVQVRDYSGGWLDAKYKMVDFGENEQYVFEEFYTKFTLVAHPMPTETIKGKWYFFRTDISVGYKTRQKVNFTSEGVPFDKMEFSDDPLEVRYIMDGKWGYSFEGGFLEEEYQPYRTVDFGDTEQTVYQDWYLTFTSNATNDVPEQPEQSEPEPEPEQPEGVLVTYNDKVIAALKAGQTAQLHIANTEVMHDLFVTVPEDIEWFNDGDTHLWIHLEEGRTSPMLGVAVNGTVTVDWGDGTKPDVLTGTGTSEFNCVFTPTHEYSAPGDYVITLTLAGEMLVSGYSQGFRTCILCYSPDPDVRNMAYWSALRKVEVGINTSVGSYAFNSAHNLASVFIPDGALSLPEDLFNTCYGLINFRVPDGVTEVKSGVFTACQSLTHLVFPASVASIERSAFYDCDSMRFYDFTNHTAVPTLGDTDAFYSIAPDCEIRVPMALVDEWKAAENWSTYADHIVGV